MADPKQQGAEKVMAVRLSNTLMHGRLGTTSSLVVAEREPIQSMELHRAGVLVVLRPIKGEAPERLIVPFAAIVHMVLA